MKIIFTIILCSVLFISCDKREDKYYLDNNAPLGSIAFQNSHSTFSLTRLNDSVFRDTLKIGQIYRFAIDLRDESPNMEFSFNGNGSLHKDALLFNSATEINNGLHYFEWTPDSIGVNHFKISITDVYGKRISYDMTIYVFENRVPVVSWVLQDVGNISPLEKKIVVSGFDGDALYGGSILYYEYVIDSDTTLFPSNVYHYVFPHSGNYLISVRAIDSNYDYSNAVIISQYNIQ